MKELDNKIESIISKVVEYYYTDWKNYDRPKYMKLKGLKENCTLIVRKCGTYLIADSEKEGSVVYEYFMEQEQADYYYIDFSKLSVKRIHKGII